MRTTILVTAAAAAATSASVIARPNKAARAAGCCFHATASGGPGGMVGQLGDGQNRIGQSSLPTGQYCLDDQGGLSALLSPTLQSFSQLT